MGAQEVEVPIGPLLLVVLLLLFVAAAVLVLERPPNEMRLRSEKGPTMRFPAKCALRG